MCFTIAVGFAPASQLTHRSNYVPPAPALIAFRPASSRPGPGQPLHPMSEETAFYYNVAISGHPEMFVDEYVRNYDDGSSAPSMNDEFQRARYRAAIRAKLIDEVKKIDFSERFTFVCPVMLGQYSFAERAFPLQMDRGNRRVYLSFSHDAGTLVFGVNPFIARQACECFRDSLVGPHVRGTGKRLHQKPDRPKRDDEGDLPGDEKEGRNGRPLVPCPLYRGSGDLLRRWPALKNWA